MLQEMSKVLIVEDNVSWLRIYEKLLKRHGYQIFIANEYPAALGLISRHFFHAAIVDIRLIEKDETNEQGMAVLNKLSETGEETGLIVITAYPTDERIKKAYTKYNVVDFIRKDKYDSEILLAGLEKAIKQSKGFLEKREKEEVNLANLIRKTNPQDIFGPGAVDEIAHLLASLARPLIPLRTSSKFERIDITGQSRVFETRYWSRAFGEAFVVRLGSRKQIVKEAEELRRSGKDPFLTTRQSMSGIRYAVSGLSPEEFSES